MRLVRNTAVSGIEDLIRQYEVNPTDILDEVGFTHAQLTDLDVFISYTKVAELLELAALKCNEPWFGLQLASIHNELTLGDFSMYLAHQATFKDAMRCASQYIASHATGIEFTTATDSDYVTIKMILNFAHKQNCNQLMQLSVGEAFNVGLLYGSQKPSHEFKLCLQQSQPASLESLPEKYQGWVHFDCEFDGVVFSGAFVNAKPTPSPEIMRQYFEGRMETQEVTADQSIRALTKKMITTMLPQGIKNIDPIAGALNLHPRILQKRLQEEGTSFRQLLQETRTEIACLRLQADTVNITQVAFSVGYKDVANFSRNFKEWTGYSPTDWRKRNT